MPLRFRRMLSRLWRASKASSTSNISENLAIAGVSSVPESINRLARSADNLSLAAEIAACIVVIGIVLEDWGAFSKLFRYPSWIGLRNAVGPLMVAGGIAFEILFSRLSSSRQRKERNWLGLRVAELDVETERLRKENNDTTLLLAYRSVGDMSALAEAMRAFSGTKYAIEFSDSNEAATLQWQLNAALNNAGWKAVSHPSRSILDGYGVWIKTIADRHGFPRSKAADALAEWLDARQVATIACVVKREGLDLGTVVIGIGPKPETIEQQRQIKDEYRKRLLEI
jgi:hypothetical protein